MSNEPAPTTESPRPAAKWLLGGVVFVAAFWILGPLASGLAIAWAIALFIGSAVSLGHTGTLADSHTFASAHWVALGALVVALAYGYAARRFRHDQRAGRGVLAPIAMLCFALPVATVLVLQLAWDSTSVPVLAGAIVLADFYFFTLLGALAAATATVLAAHAVFAWAELTRLRTRLTSVVLVVVLAALALTGYRREKSNSASDRSSWTQHVPQASGAGVLELMRALMRALTDLSKLGDKGAPSKASPTSASAAAPVPSASLLAKGQPAAPTSKLDSTTAVEECLKELRDEVAEVKRNVAKKSGVSPHDAHDIAYQALLDVCERHAVTKYTKLKPVLQVAANRRAASGFRERKRRACQIIDLDTLPCAPGDDDYGKLDEILDAVRCHADDRELMVLRLRVGDDLTFTEIDEALNWKPGKAHERFSNYLTKSRKFLEKACTL